MSRFPQHRTDRRYYPGPGLDLPVLYNDLDPNGHLNNVAFGRFFEHARTIQHRLMGLHELYDDPEPYRLLVARVAIDYLAEVGMNEAVHVRVRTAKIGSSSLVEESAAWSGEVCIALAEDVIALRRSGAAATWPEGVRATMHAHRHGERSVEGRQALP